MIGVRIWDGDDVWKAGDVWMDENHGWYDGGNARFHSEGDTGPPMIARLWYVHAICCWIGIMCTRFFNGAITQLVDGLL